MRRPLAGVGLVALMGLWPAMLAAQPGEPVDDPERMDGAPTGGVYVPDSGEALQKIRQAQRLAKAQQWDQAAQMLHEIQTRYGHRVLSEGIGFYVGVAEYVNDLLAQWPEEGLRVYRRRYDGLAKAAYDQAVASGSAVEMASVARQYWASSIGAQAADEAAELSLESGRFSTAIDLWSRLLALPPGSAILDKGHIPPIMAKLAVALVWNGQPAEAKKLRDRLTKEYADWPNTFGGEAASLVKWAEGFTQSLVAANTRLDSSGDYPVFGGGMDRNIVAPSDLSFGAELWSFSGHKGSPQGGVDPMTGRAFPRGRSPYTPTLHPVVAGGRIFMSTPAGVFCLSAVSGTLPIWHNDEFRSSTVNQMGGMPTVQLFSPTYSEGRLYVDYGTATIRNPWGGGDTSGGCGLACMDANTGQLIWKFEVDSLPGLRGGFVDSSPVAFGGRVYLVAHVVRSVFDQIHLIALDGRTGRLIWQQQISEADSGTGWSFVRGQTVLPAAEGNTVYLATNMGTVAAVAADTGLVRWLRQYERIGRSRDGQPFVTVNPTTAQASRELAPTLVWNGRVVVAPPDCADLLVIDTQTGKLLFKVNRKKDLYDAKEVFGIADGKLYVRGTQVACWDLVANKPAWPSGISLDGEVSHRGRLTRQYLYIPTDKYLLRMDLAKNGQTERFPWNPGSDGTLMLIGQQVITVNATRIAGFCEWEEAERRAKADIAAAPAELKPEKILVLAKYAYATRRLKMAQDELARSVAAAGGFEALVKPDFKRDVFVSALDFARETWKENPAATLELLRMASLCPPDVEGHVRYRMTLARYWDDHRDWPQAVRYYQEILADPTLRTAAYVIDAENRADAGRYARDAIDALIASRGQAVYRAVAQQADLDYDQVLARQAWSEVERLAYQYPNAPRTVTELFRLAEHYASTKDYESAVNWLRYFRREYPVLLDRTPAQDVRALALLADYSLLLRQQWLDRTDVEEKVRLSQSRRALRQAHRFVTSGRKHPQAQVTLAGVQASFLDHRARLEAEHGKLLQMLPQVNGPLRLAKEITQNVNCRLLKPQIGPGPMSNDDVAIVLAMSGQGWDLLGYRPGRSAAPIWTRKYDLQRGGNTNLVTYFEDVAVIVQWDRLKGVNPENGEIVWNAEFKEGRQNQPRFFARHENFLFAGGQASAIVVDMDSGKVVSEFNLADMMNTHPDMNERLASYVCRQQQFKLVVLDWRTGRVVSRFDPPSPDVQWTSLAGDGRVLLAGGQNSVSALDVETGRLLWKADHGGQVFNPIQSYIVRGRWLYSGLRVGTQWQVTMRDIEDKGKVVWNRPVPAGQRTAFTGAFRMTLQDDELIVMSDGAVAVLDGETGEVSWVPTMRQDDQIRDFLVTQDYLVLVCWRNPNVRGIAAGGVAQMNAEVRLYDRTAGGGRLEQSLSLSMENWGQLQVSPASPGLIVQSGRKLQVLLPRTGAEDGPVERILPPDVEDGPAVEMNQNGVMLKLGG